MMLDAMAPVTVLSQFFQTENADVALVTVKLNLCLADLAKVTSLETPHLKLLNQELQPGLYKEHHIHKSAPFNLQKLTEEFIIALKANIKARFPDDFIKAFGILCMRPISFLSTEQLEEYGNKEVEKLCQHYGNEQSVEWKVDGGTDKKTTPPLINEADTKSEWALLKRVVLAEQYPRDSMQILLGLINKFHGKEFPNVIVLAQLALTLAIHTAVQNQTLTPSRNRLNIDKQDMLMRVRLGPSRQDYNFEATLQHWKRTKRGGYTS